MSFMWKTCKPAIFSHRGKEQRLLLCFEFEQQSAALGRILEVNNSHNLPVNCARENLEADRKILYKVIVSRNE